MSNELSVVLIHLAAGWYAFVETFEGSRAYEATGPFLSMDAALAWVVADRGNPGTFSRTPGDLPQDPEPWMVPILAHALTPAQRRAGPLPRLYRTPRY